MDQRRPLSRWNQLGEARFLEDGKIDEPVPGQKCLGKYRQTYGLNILIDRGNSLDSQSQGGDSQTATTVLDLTLGDLRADREPDRRQAGSLH